MGQIVKKKKGRPSKADLAARAAAESTNGHNNHRRRESDEEEEQRDIRRSLRRRNCVRYNLLDYDEDYLDDDHDFNFDDGQLEDDDEEGGGKREKKLKFVLKLPNSANRGRSIRNNGGGGDSAIHDRRAGYRGSDAEGEEEEEDETRFVKKRKICGDGDDDDEVDDDYSDNEDEEEAGRKAESYNFDFFHGIPNIFSSRVPMPEKKRLELLLDKLQKKDTYGVYAEPVDPDELPDYHEIIKHPMNFATVRKKLGDGSYSTLEQFESDIYLICSNAMQYNAPDTIYHKQARAIMELAQKKFQRVRRDLEWTCIEHEQTKTEAKSEQKTKLNPVIKKQLKRPISLTTQDPVSSDFSSGATLATTNAHKTSNGIQASNHDRPSNDEAPEGISSLAEENIEKVEDLQSGKGMSFKLGRKLLVADENRRGTYEISNQLEDKSESIFSTFEGEDKQLIPVGLYEEHSYAESLARFAATLGPAAWRIASKRIEEALPRGSKFGRGWVVEYEPIPTPVLFVAGHCQKEYSSAKKPQGPAQSVQTNKLGETLYNSSKHVGPSRNGKTCLLPCSGGSRPPTPSSAVVQQQNPFVRKLQNAAIPVKCDIPSESASTCCSEEKRPLQDVKLPHMPSLSGSRPTTTTGVSIQQQHPFVRKLQNAYIPAKTVDSPESVVTTSERLDGGPISEGKSSILPCNSRGSRPCTPTGAAIQMQNPFSRNNLRPDKTVATRVDSKTPTLQQTRHFPGSPEIGTSLQADTIAKDKNFLHSVPSRSPQGSEGFFLGRLPDWNVNGPIDMNRMAGGACTQLTGKKTSFPPRQEQGLSDPVQAMKLSSESGPKNQNEMNNMLGPLQVRPCIQSITGVGSWMHVNESGHLSAHSNQISADSLHNRTRGEMYPHIVHSGEYSVSGKRHERSRATVFSQVPVSEASRNPLQSSWQGLTEQKKKRDSLPPDLNIAFQSTVDSQQPDLALQL